MDVRILLEFDSFVQRGVTSYYPQVNSLSIYARHCQRYVNFKINSVKDGTRFSESDLILVDFVRKTDLLVNLDSQFLLADLQGVFSYMKMNFILIVY